MWGSTGIKFRASPIFLLYVNDLPNCLDLAEPSMFADDTNISTSAGSVEKLETQLNIELDKIYRWLVANRLTLNVSKTEYDYWLSSQTR